MYIRAAAETHEAIRDDAGGWLSRNGLGRWQCLATPACTAALQFLCHRPAVPSSAGMSLASVAAWLGQLQQWLPGDQPVLAAMQQWLMTHQDELDKVRRRTGEGWRRAPCLTPCIPPTRSWAAG